MSSKEIKDLAKEKIKGNIWNLLWPVLIIYVITSVLTNFFGPKIIIDANSLENLKDLNLSEMYTEGNSVITFIISMISAILTACYMKYVLNFIRKGKFDTNDIINTLKEKWLDLLIANILTSLIVGIGFALLIIPGIIASLALAMINYFIIDQNAKGSDSMKLSNEAMKGHKGELFVFRLSFIGWFILVPFTFGLLLIWLIPYTKVAEALYYDKIIAPKKK